MTDVQRRASRIVDVAWIGFGKAAKRKHIGTELDDVDRVDGWFADGCCHGCSPRGLVTMGRRNPGRWRTGVIRVRAELVVGVPMLRRSPSPADA